MLEFLNKIHLKRIDIEADGEGSAIVPTVLISESRIDKGLSCLKHNKKKYYLTKHKENFK